MATASDGVEKVAQELNSMLMAFKSEAPSGMTESTLNKKYKEEISGKNIPFEELGFGSIRELVEAHPNKLRMSNRGFVQYVSQRETAAIETFVNDQSRGKMLKQDFAPLRTTSDSCGPPLRGGAANRGGRGGIRRQFLPPQNAFRRPPPPGSGFGESWQPAIRSLIGPPMGFAAGVPYQRGYPSVPVWSGDQRTVLHSGLYVGDSTAVPRRTETFVAAPRMSRVRNPPPIGGPRVPIKGFANAPPPRASSSPKRTYSPPPRQQVVYPESIRLTPVELRNNIVELLLEYSEGARLSDIPELFNAKFGVFDPEAILRHTWRVFVLEKFASVLQIDDPKSDSPLVRVSPKYMQQNQLSYRSPQASIAKPVAQAAVAPEPQVEPKRAVVAPMPQVQRPQPEFGNAAQPSVPLVRPEPMRPRVAQAQPLRRDQPAAAAVSPQIESPPPQDPKQPNLVDINAQKNELAELIESAIGMSGVDKIRLSQLTATAGITIKNRALKALYAIGAPYKLVNEVEDDGTVTFYITHREQHQDARNAAPMVGLFAPSPPVTDLAYELGSDPDWTRVPPTIADVCLPLPQLPTAELPFTNDQMDQIDDKDLARYVEVELMNMESLKEIFAVTRVNADILVKVHERMSAFYSTKLESHKILPCHITLNCHVIVHINGNIFRRAIIDQPVVQGRANCARVFLLDSGEVHKIAYDNILYLMKEFGFPGCAFVLQWGQADKFVHPVTGDHFTQSMISAVLEEQAASRRVNIFVVDVVEECNRVIMEDILFTRDNNQNAFFSTIATDKLGFQRVNPSPSSSVAPSVAPAANHYKDVLNDLEEEFEMELMRDDFDNQPRPVEVESQVQVRDIASVLESQPSFTQKIPHVLAALDGMRKRFDRILVLEQNESVLENMDNVKKQVRALQRIVPQSSYPLLFAWATQ